ncbi:MAG: branched-chain amino acid ABC transporter permease [Synergistaceae bacterium]|nr:branched-chain amino acid ABC transporter permease [Synergistaceae bacterium]
MSIGMFFQHFINAIALGSLYGLIAIGYTMVYGILRLINFAHGEIFMLGAYFMYFGSIVYGLPWWTSVAIAIVGATVCGLLVERVAYRPLRQAPRISALISAIGVSFFIQNLAVVLFTGMPRTIVQPDWLMQPWVIEGLTIFNKEIDAIRILPLAIMVLILTIILVLILLWIVYRTKPGLGMRAISKDIETTRLMGVSVNKIIAFSFALGSALAAVAGILWALRYPKIEPFMGVIPGLKAFIAAVFGGIGSIQGAMIGGMVIGFVEIMAVAFYPDMSGYRDAFAFVILVAVLLFRPTGLLGEKLEDKI